MDSIFAKVSIVVDRYQSLGGLTWLVPAAFNIESAMACSGLIKLRQHLKRS